MALPEQPSLNRVPLWVFTDKSYFVGEPERHNSITEETTIAASGGTKQFGFVSGQYSTGGAKYNRSAVGFESDDFTILEPVKTVNNILKGATLTTTNTYGVDVSVNGTGGTSTVPTDGEKKVGSSTYLIGNTVNNLPSAGLHEPGQTVEDASTPGSNYMEFDLGSIRYVGALHIYFKCNTAPSTEGSFVYYKVKTSTDASTYTYVAGQETPSDASTTNQYGWKKSEGFPSPPILEDGDLFPTTVMINDEVRYIRIITDGNRSGEDRTADATTTLAEKTAEVYEIETSQVEGYRYSGRNHLCIKKTADGSDLTDAEWANIDLEFKDFGNSAYIKITNNNAFEVYIYSLELYGLWVLKASEVDSLNGTIRISKTDPTVLYEPQTLVINNDLFQFPDYAELVADSLLDTHKTERLRITVQDMPLDLTLKNMNTVKFSIEDISDSVIKSVVKRKIYRISKSESKISIVAEEDKNIPV
jgi:hypothetical protein